MACILSVPITYVNMHQDQRQPIDSEQQLQRHAHQLKAELQQLRDMRKHYVVNSQQQNFAVSHTKFGK